MGKWTRKRRSPSPKGAGPRGRAERRAPPAPCTWMAAVYVPGAALGKHFPGITSLHSCWGPAGAQRRSLVQVPHRRLRPTPRRRPRQRSTQQPLPPRPPRTPTPLRGRGRRRPGRGSPRLARRFWASGAARTPPILRLPIRERRPARPKGRDLLAPGAWGAPRGPRRPTNVPRFPRL